MAEIKPFDPNNEGITLDVAGLVKLQQMLTPEVEKFRSLRNDYRESCKPAETPEVSEETDFDTEDCVTNLVSEIRSSLLNNPEVAVLLHEELSALATDVKQVSKDFLASQGRETSDGDGDEKLLATFLDQRDRVSSVFKLFEGLKTFVMDKANIDELKKAGLQLQKNTKKNAKMEWVTKNPNDPSGSADELGNSKAGRPSSSVQTFVYEYVIDSKPVESQDRYEVMLQASEGASSIYTWQDLHTAMKEQDQKIGADSFTVTMPNGVVIEGTKVQK